jgi:hypothetical protein
MKRGGEEMEKRKVLGKGHHQKGVSLKAMSYSKDVCVINV